MRNNVAMTGRNGALRHWDAVTNGMALHGALGAQTSAAAAAWDADYAAPIPVH